LIRCFRLSELHVRFHHTRQPWAADQLLPRHVCADFQSVMSVAIDMPCRHQEDGGLGADGNPPQSTQFVAQ
jgi:hypothetical protein